MTSRRASILNRVGSPLADWRSLDRWVSASLLLFCGIVAVVCTQFSGLLSFYSLDCNGPQRSELLGVAYWTFAAAPAAVVLIGSVLAVFRAHRAHRIWPIAASSAALIAGLIGLADLLARLATESC